MKYLQKWVGRRYEPNIENEYFEATVPGNIQSDYIKYIGLENPMYSDNLTVMEKTEEWFWEYKTVLDIKAENDEKVFFVSEGIDYSYDVLLDGEVLLSHTGMFSHIEVELTSKIKQNSVLQVIIHPHPKHEGGYIKMRDLARQCCKPPVTYGWDFNPRLLVSGLWQPAYIETRKPCFIYNCEPFYELNAERTEAAVRFETECSGEVNYTLYDNDGKVVYSGTNPEFTVDNVKLWWCNGHGEPYLYKWEAKSKDDIKSGRIGFRTIAFIQNVGANNEPLEFPKSRYSAFVTVYLNGKRIFAKGSNLVNADIFPGNVERERYEELVELARDANFNMFRIWGGGGLHKDDFYEICDEKGIMVWQEFMLACNNYYNSKNYLATLEQEATAIIKRLRSHPCHTLWCGGNELFNGWSYMSEQSHALRLLDKLTYELDQNKPFIMTSPLCGMAHGGYTFVAGGPETEVFYQFHHAHNTAYTEFGVPSMADYETLKKIIPEDEIDDLKNTKSWEYHHAFGVWGENRWCCNDVINDYFGKQTDTKEYIRYTRWMQAEGLKAIFEEARRQWPYCSMVLNWCMNEPWITAANNSIISYPLNPKPAYYAIKNALSPVLASARFDKFKWIGDEMLGIELWLLNDSDNDAEDKISVEVELGGETYKLLEWETGVVEAMKNKMGPTAHLQLPDSVDTEFLIVRVISKNNTSSEYKLQYKSKKPIVKTGQLNV